MTVIAPTVPPADGAALPTPPTTADPTTFDARADAYFLAEVAFQTAMNLLKANVYTNTTAAYQNALATALDAASTAANAALAATYAGAIPWVSGTTYAIGDKRTSLINGFIYRRLIAGAGTTDPSADTTNWAPASLATPVQVVTGLVQQAISGGAYAATNTAAQAAATNLALYSSQADQATWVKSSMTVSADFAMSPTGATDADKLIEAAATAAHNLSQVVTVAANVAYTYSVEVKAAGRSTIALSLDRDSGMVDYIKAKFDLTGAGVSSIASGGTGSGAAATCTHLGNGFYLCTLTGTPSTTAGTTVRPMLHLSDFNSSYAGDGTSGVLVAEAQLETGTAATSRIATVSTTAARPASVVAPTRFIAPPSPVADAFWEAVVQNGVTTNVVDLNGSTFYGQNGVVVLNNAFHHYKFQYVNGTWRFVS